jgi:heme A synthase
MLYWRWFNRPRHPLLRVLLAAVGAVALVGILTLGFFALLAFAFIGTIVALTRALTRSHASVATAAAQPRPAADQPRVIEGEFIVVEPRQATTQH